MEVQGASSDIERALQSVDAMHLARGTCILVRSRQLVVVRLPFSTSAA
jgi:hypothetical protein